MDINVTLADLRSTINAIETIDLENGTADWDRINDAINLFSNLDGWLSKGGFLPKDWRPSDSAARALANPFNCPAGYANCAGKAFPGHNSHTPWQG